MKLSTSKIITRTLFLFGGAAMAWSLAACDEKDTDDRYIELPAVESARVVLLEEYTGQKCVNCPDGHEIINQLTQQYPDNFIAVGIHGGGDTWSYAETALGGKGLRNEDGQAYSEEAGATTFPCGIVNRTSGLLNKEQWASAVRSEIEKPANMEITLEAYTLAEEDNSTIYVNTLVSPYENVTGHLQIWVVEDNIVTYQLTSSGMNANYVHNHVFRGVVNGHDGEAVTLVTREEQTFNNSVAMSERWTLENLDIVAFVYDDNGVQQAARVKVNATTATE